MGRGLYMIYVPRSVITKELINELIEKGERFIVRDEKSPVFWEPVFHPECHEAWGYRDRPAQSVREWREREGSYSNRYTVDP